MNKSSSKNSSNAAYTQQNELTQALDTQKKNKQSLDRMLTMTQASQEVGTATVVKLMEQEEQLTRIHEGVHSVRDNAARANYHIRGAESVGGAIMNSMSSAPSGTKRHESVASETEVSETSQVSETSRLLQDHQYSPSSSSSFSVKNKNNPHLKQFNANHNEEERSLMAVSQNLDVLNEIAVDVGTAVDRQNKKLEKVGDEVDAAEADVFKVNGRAKRLMYEQESSCCFFC